VHRKRARVLIGDTERDHVLQVARARSLARLFDL
jgi:hypothetical protein